MPMAPHVARCARNCKALHHPVAHQTPQATYRPAAASCKADELCTPNNTHHWAGLQGCVQQQGTGGCYGAGIQPGARWGWAPGKTMQRTGGWMLLCEFTS